MVPMSFSHEVKRELASLAVQSKKHILSELFGILGFSGTILKNVFTASFENKDIINRIKILLNSYGFKSNKEYFIKKYKSPSNFNYNITVNNFNFLDTKYYQYILNDETLYADFLRGVFLACGSILNPENEYHLEFNTYSKQCCKFLIKTFEICPTLNYTPSAVQRRNRYIIYLKNNEKITDFLTFIGSQQCVMKYIQIKMLKEVRNNINRSTNFETANLSKITISSTEHVKAIKKIQKITGLGSLPECLKETAILRIKNPYVSLKELAELHENPVSKSGVNHRLKKIIEISSNL